MRLTSHADVQSFLAAAGPLLAADEARHNLIYGITSALRDAPDVYRAFHLWTVEDDGDSLGAFVMTPPYNIIVAQPRRDDAIPFAVEGIVREGVRCPGVTGALPEVDAFSAAWEREANVTARVRMRQGVYGANAVRAPRNVQGAMRLARHADRELLVAWLHAFQEEALPDDAPHGDLERLVDRRIAGGSTGIALWELDGRTVSLAGYGGPTPHGIRIAPVYTPPDLRRNGYGSAVTAALTQHLLSGGLEYCFLYTDLANATSNRIYTDVGYRLVCESRDYAFD